MSGLLEWIACSDGCSCANHTIPSHTLAALPAALDNFDHLKGTNNPLHPAEEDTLRGIIADLKSRIDTVNATKSRLLDFRAECMSQVSVVDARVAALVREVDTLKQAVAGAQAPLSAVRRLPSEILSRIFAGVIQFPAPMLPSYDLDAQDPPRHDRDFYPTKNSLWSIELVCKQWRRAVLDSPRLWSSIVIVINDKNFTEGNNRYLRRIGVHLGRSGQHPLSICICNHRPRSHFSTLPPFLAPFLLAYAPRMERLELYLRPAMVAGFSLLKFSFRSLTDIVLLNSGREAYDHSAISVFAEAPVLRHVTIVDYRRADSSFQLPWTSITKYYSSYMLPLNDIARHRHHASPSMPRLLQILGKMPALQEFSTRCPDIISVPPRLKHCPTLRRFKIVSGLPGQRTSGIHQILGFIQTPVLSSLEVNCAAVTEDTRDNEHVFTAICSLVMRSSCPLTVLHFNCGTITIDLSRVIAATPTLVEIRLTDVGLLHEWELDIFVGSLTRSEVVPRLSVLQLSGDLKLKPEGLSDMVEARWADDAIERLKNIDLCWFSQDAEAESNHDMVRTLIHSRLDRLCQDGLILKTSTLLKPVIGTS